MYTNRNTRDERAPDAGGAGEDDLRLVLVDHLGSGVGVKVGAKDSRANARVVLDLIKEMKEQAMKTIETEGTIDDKGRLVLRKKLDIAGPTRVRVIILSPEDDKEDDESVWMKSAASNPAFDFLNDEAEDIYTLADGMCFDDAP